MSIPQPCTIEGCVGFTTPKTARGMCQFHYSSFIAHGDPLRAKKLEGIAGKRFGELIALRVAYSKNGTRFWECICDCGNTAYVARDKLTSLHTKSCGCINTRRLTKHNMIDNPAYRCWVKMKNRCLNPSNDMYHHYGGRGITVYGPWVDDFKAFYDYIGARPSAGHSIDRKNVNGNYEPGNVRWSTQAEQMRNTRRQLNRTVGVDVHKKSGMWRARISTDKVVVHLGLFSSIDSAIEARKAAEAKYWGTII